MVDKEMLAAIQQLLEPIDLRLMNMENRISNLDNKIGNLENRITNLEYEMRRGFRQTHQDIETIVEVLEAKGILPKAQ